MQYRFAAGKRPTIFTIHFFAVITLLLFSNGLRADDTAVASWDEMVASKKDAWGEAAIAQPDGPSYEFFEKLLAPARYVNADFKYYPIVLSAPNARVKARLISNGSGINLHAGTRAWHDGYTPVMFRVGPDEGTFGEYEYRLEQPALAEGFLPIFQIRYVHPTPVQAEGIIPLNQSRTTRTKERYSVESFASTDPALAENAVVFSKFTLPEGANGTVTILVDSKSNLKFENNKLVDEKGEALVYFDSQWKLATDNAGKWMYPRIRAHLTPKTAATIAVPTKSLGASSKLGLTASTYLEQREMCAATWRKVLAGGMNVETPEAVVNNAWRQLVIQNFSLINGNSMRYSAGNQYDALYEAEGSDAALAFLVWGYESDMRRLMYGLFDFLRKGLEFHQAGFKLNDICRYYWQTRDPAIFKEFDARWKREAQRLDKNRTGEHGLFPKEQYCGDVHTPVQSLNVNSKAWRALRDLGVTLAEIGDRQNAAHYTQVASDFRKTVLTAIEKSTRHETTPPFIPIALYTNEPPHDPICDVRIGSYWNIIIGYTIASGIFPVGSERENWLPHYVEQHGGLCMGMVRAGGLENTFWNTEYKVNPLYGTRYALDTLRRDDVDRALVSFYGMLAQGFTRNTFIGSEGSSLKPLDQGGRLISLPPNSAANAHFLSMLRYLLVQDSDLNDDGKPETLRLCFATPGRWLADGKSFKVENAPTAFGRVSVKMESHLSQGEVVASVDLPSRNRPDKVLLRARVPGGWRVVSAKADQTNLAVDEKGTVDVTTLKGKQTIRFAVKQ